MIDKSIQNKIKKIKIHTRRVMQSTLAGDYLSAFKGSGLEFHQIREYTPGDDIRSIDWNSSAKMNKLMIKQFIEERDRTIILAIDVSGSTFFGSQNELRKESIAQIAATLTFIAAENKDKVGVLFFSDHTEEWIPPKKGNVHLGRIIETIFTLRPKSKKTSIASALRFLIQLKKRNAVVFMISDWIESYSYNKLLKVASYEYDFVGVRVTDAAEQQLPDIGFLEIEDAESGQKTVLDTRGSQNTNNLLTKLLQGRIAQQKKLFEKYRIDMLDLTVGQPFVNPLISFFHKRIRRQI